MDTGEATLQLNVNPMKICERGPIDTNYEPPQLPLARKEKMKGNVNFPMTPPPFYFSRYTVKKGLTDSRPHSRDVYYQTLPGRE